MRTVSNISIGSTMPPKGKYNCSVVAIDKGVSSNKKTPYIEPTLSTGEDDFTDQLYVTPKTIGRLSLFARRVCGMPDDFPLSDDDTAAANELAKFIMQNAVGKSCIVTIEENEEMFIPTTGPDAGRTKVKLRRKVAFKGYERFEEPLPPSSNTTPEDDLPF